MMNIRLKLMRGKLGRARHVWGKHAEHCACCRSARSAATLCPKGVELWTSIAQHEVDLDSLERGKGMMISERLGVAR